MSKVNSYTLDKILKNIDAFIDGRPAETSDIQPYSTLFNDYPFTSGKVKAKIANRIVHPPLKVVKKSLLGYFHQQDRELMMTQQKLAVLEEKIDYLQDTIVKLSQVITDNTELRR